MINSNKSGFSLAEALITMLIVMMVAIMSTDVIAKRSVKNYSIRGHWECIYNPVTKKYSQKSIHYDGATNDFGEILSDNTGCVFHPQPNAKSYIVNVIGGGGGGASSSSDNDYVYANTNVRSFIPEFDGEYEVVAVGAGGNRGHQPCGSYSGGGGAGQVSYGKFNLIKENVYTLVPGVYGVYETSDPGASYFKHNETNLLSASPGRKGQARDKDRVIGFQVDCRWRSVATAGTSQSPNIGVKPFSGDSSYDSRSPVPGEICRSSGDKVVCADTVYPEGSANRNAVNFLEFIGNTGAGKGCNGGENYQSSNFGLVAIRYAGLYAGGGGKAGNHVLKTIKKITDDVTVRIGNGGRGAYVEYSHGMQGEPTLFGDLAIAPGGMGGLTRAVTGPAVDETAFLAGANGVKSVLGGFQTPGPSADDLNGRGDMDNTMDGLVMPQDDQYGAGGGGGSAKYCTSKDRLDAEKRRDCWGKGGRGMPGFVSVEWY